MYIFADPTSRGKAVCKCKKLAYQRAVENAFSKVIIVVLSNGKVAVEVDTTQPELLLTEKVLDDENVLKVLASMCYVPYLLYSTLYLNIYRRITHFQYMNIELFPFANLHASCVIFEF